MIKLDINKQNFPFLNHDLEDNLMLFKRVVVATAIFKSIYLLNSGGYFFIKYICILLVSYFLAKGLELLYYTKVKKFGYVESKQILKQSGASITPLLFAIAVPTSISVVNVIISVFVGVFIAKNLMGGFTYNFLNPAVTSVVTSNIIAFKNFNYTVGTHFFDNLLVRAFNFDKDYTPFALRQGFLESSIHGYGVFDKLAVVYVFVVLLYFIYKRIVYYKIPITILGCSAFMITAIVGLSYVFNLGYVDYFDGSMSLFIYSLFMYYITSMIPIGAVFYATDPITSPNSKYGATIYSVLIAIISVVLEIFFHYHYAIFYAILFCNVITPLMNKYVLDKSESYDKKFKIFMSLFLVVVTLIVFIVIKSLS